MEHAAKLAILSIVLIAAIPVTLAGYSMENNVHKTLKSRLCPNGLNPVVYQSAGYGGAGTLQIRCVRGNIPAVGNRFNTHYNKKVNYQKFDRFNPQRGEEIYG